MNKEKPTQMSGFVFGGPFGPYFELFLNLLYNFANYVYTGIKKF